jgi:hypothetical protein
MFLVMAAEPPESENLADVDRLLVRKGQQHNLRVWEMITIPLR